MKKTQFKLKIAFKKLKKEARTGGESTDDEDMAKQAEELFEKHSKAISNHQSVRFHDVDTYEGRQQAALEYLHDMRNSSTDKDSDEDQLEFAKADVEEVEDNLLKAIQKNQTTLST